MFRSTKIKDGYSTCFRQWKADNTHCKFLHGYGTSVKFVFEGNLDERNWVVDFGGFKRATQLISVDGVDKKFTPDQWLKWLLDHTTIIAEDDPQLQTFKNMHDSGIIQLRVIPATGCEKFAQYIYQVMENWLRAEFGLRVRLVSVEFKEHEKNSGIYFD